MLKKENYWYELFVILLCIFVILPLFMLAKYNRPSADDYDYAMWTSRAVWSGKGPLGIIAAAIETDRQFYGMCQGLYVSAFCLAFQPGILGENMYFLATYMILAVIMLFTLSAVHILNKEFLHKSFLYSLTTSIVIITIVCLWMPNVNQGLYWYNGSMNYLPWIFGDYLNLTLVFMIYKYSPSKKMIPYLLTSTLLSFILSGVDHVTSFANILYLIVMSVLFIKEKHYWGLVPLVSACIGFGVMLIAPGTAARAATMDSAPVITTMLATLRHVRVIMGEWINIQWIILLILATPFAIMLCDTLKLKIRIYHVLLCGTICFTVLCGMFCVPFLPMWSFGDGRLTNVIWVAFTAHSVFMHCVIIGWFYSCDWISIKKVLNQKSFELKRWSLIGISIILMTFICISGKRSNSLSAYLEIHTGVAQAYAAQMDERIALYNDTSLEEVILCPIKNKNSLLFFADAGDDPNIWPSTSISRYYGKRIWVDSSLSENKVR